MNRIKIAIISDLHCHHSSSGSSDSLLLSDLPRRPEKQHPVSALDLLIEKEALEADVVLMPGDMANRADPQGMNTAWDFIKKIAISLRSEVLSSTLGNHDVIWKVPCDDSFKTARNLLPQFPSEHENNNSGFWSNGYYFDETLNSLRILVINSVKHQTNEISAKRGLISEAQLNGIEGYMESAQDKIFQIAVCHHHPIQHEEIELGPTDLMENGSRLVELLSKFSYDLLVHGHKHHTRLKIDSSGGNPLPVFAAGSFSACMTLGLGTRARNVFHLVELEKIESSTHSIGKIMTWQFQHQLGWTKASQCAADFPHLAGFGATASAQELAGLIEATFRTQNREVLAWTTIIESHPDVDRVPPAVLRAISQILQSRGLQLTPDAPDRPKFIGIPT